MLMGGMSVKEDKVTFTHTHPLKTNTHLMHLYYRITHTNIDFILL